MMIAGLHHAVPSLPGRPPGGKAGVRPEVLALVHRGGPAHGPRLEDVAGLPITVGEGRLLGLVQENFDHFLPDHLDAVHRLPSDDVHPLLVPTVLGKEVIQDPRAATVPLVGRGGRIDLLVRGMMVLTVHHTVESLTVHGIVVFNLTPLVFLQVSPGDSQIFKDLETILSSGVCLLVCLLKVNLSQPLGRL